MTFCCAQSNGIELFADFLWVELSNHALSNSEVLPEKIVVIIQLINYSKQLGGNNFSFGPFCRALDTIIFSQVYVPIRFNAI